MYIMVLKGVFTMRLLLSIMMVFIIGCEQEKYIEVEKPMLSDNPPLIYQEDNTNK